ncbi:MAG: Gfo/Idh/MocA family oxidoreductase [Sphingobacteriaceae bacterium]
MKVNLIIGAGQLGSRHLQGLLKLETNQEVYVLDPSEQSIKIAKDRAAEISNTHTVHYVNNWNGLPFKFDLVIVSTTANVRKKIILKLLNEFELKFLILEKILFQDISSYSEILKLISDKQVRTWVNHPRRMFDHYNLLKNSLRHGGAIIQFHVIGSNWGLGCNGLHFIDLCAYLCSSKISNINSKLLDNDLLDTKRPGYVEFSGTLTGEMENGSSFSISSFNSSKNQLSIFISSNERTWIVDEGGSSNILYLNKNDSNDNYKHLITSTVQSSLTTKLANDLFSIGDCNLPTYAEACESHKPFIESLLEKYNSITGSNIEICPIT